MRLAVWFPLLLLGVGCAPPNEDAAPDLAIVDLAVMRDLLPAPLLPCPQVFGVCTDFVDATAVESLRAVEASGNRYVEPCLRIKVGQTVTFSMSFYRHPLAPACGPSPEPTILPVKADFSSSFTFDTPGVHGYFCKAHGRATGWGMSGAIDVVP